MVPSSERKKTWQAEFEKTERGKEVRRRAVLKHRYGISPEDYDAMLLAQGGVCALCGHDTPRNGTRRFFSVDHDHSTGRVRGLLCLRCNNSLGWYENHRQAVDAYLS